MIARLLLTLLIAAPFTAAASFEFETIADQVTLAKPTDPGRQRIERVNSLIVDLGDALFVAEPQPSRASAEALLAAIAERWPEKPIRFLALPYPTMTSSAGAVAFPDSASVIASYRLVDAWADPAYDRAAELRSFGEVGELPEPRQPDLIIHGRFRIRGEGVTVQVDLAQPAYSRGGLVIHVPEANLHYVGALLDGDLAAPMPTIGDTGKWAAMLNLLIARDAPIYIGRQGPPIDNLTLRRYRDGVAWIRGQIEYGFIKHVPVETIVARILEDPEFGSYFALDLSPDGGKTVVQKTIDEVLAFRATRGMPPPDATTRKKQP